MDTTEGFDSFCDRLDAFEYEIDGYLAGLSLQDGRIDEVLYAVEDQREGRFFNGIADAYGVPRQTFGEEWVCADFDLIITDDLIMQTIERCKHCNKPDLTYYYTNQRKRNL